MQPQMKNVLKYADNAPDWAQRFLITKTDVVYFSPYTEENVERVRFMFLGDNIVMRTSWEKFSNYYHGEMSYPVFKFMAIDEKAEDQPKEQKTVATWNGIGEPPIGATVYVEFVSNQGSALYRGVLMYNSEQTVVIEGGGVEMAFTKENDFYRIFIRP